MFVPAAGWHTGLYGLILWMLNSAKPHDRETMWSVNICWLSIMTPRLLAALEVATDKDFDIDVGVYGLFGWEDQQFRFNQIKLKMVILHPCGYNRETIRDPRRDSCVVRRERQIQLGIICIAVM